MPKDVIKKKLSVFCHMQDSSAPSSETMQDKSRLTYGNCWSCKIPVVGLCWYDGPVWLTDGALSGHQEFERLCSGKMSITHFILKLLHEFVVQVCSKILYFAVWSVRCKGHLLKCLWFSVKYILWMNTEVHDDCE